MRSSFLVFIVALATAGNPCVAADQVVIHVDAAAASGGDGSARFPYNNTEQVPSADAWPSGQAVAGTETRVFPTNPLSSQPVVLVGRSDAVVVRGVRISGFIFQATATAIGVLLNRVQDFWIADNVFRGPAFLGMQSVASPGA